MTNSQQEKYLVPVPNQPIARLSDETAKLFYKTRRGPTRLSDIYIGRYGTLGFVETNTHFFNMETHPERTEIWNILEIPETVWNETGKVRGLRGYVKETVLHDQEPCEEEFDHPSLSNTPYFDRRYFWIMVDGVRPEWHKLNQYIEETKQQAIRRIVEFETMLDRLSATASPESRPQLRQLYPIEPELKEGS